MVVININNKIVLMKLKWNILFVCCVFFGINFMSKKILIIEIIINKNKYGYFNVFVIVLFIKGLILIVNVIEELIIVNVFGFLVGVINFVIVIILSVINVVLLFVCINFVKMIIL